MNERKRWKGLIVFTPFIALALMSLLMTNGVTNQYIFGVALLIFSGIGCAEALLGWTRPKQEEEVNKK